MTSLLADLGEACRTGDHARAARLALEIHIAAVMGKALPGEPVLNIRGRDQPADWSPSLYRRTQ